MTISTPKMLSTIFKFWWQIQSPTLIVTKNLTMSPTSGTFNTLIWTQILKWFCIDVGDKYNEMCWWHIEICMWSVVTKIQFWRNCTLGFKNELWVLSTVMMICGRNLEWSLCQKCDIVTDWDVDVMSRECLRTTHISIFTVSGLEVPICNMGCSKDESTPQSSGARLEVTFWSNLIWFNTVWD